MGLKSSKTKKDLTVLTQDDIARLTSSTVYTEDQIRDWHRGFIRDCPNGKLDKKKFVEVYKKFYPEGKAEKFCAQVFSTFDTDNSGYIDFVEFLVAVNITSHGNVREKLYLAFNMYDINKNGKFLLAINANTDHDLRGKLYLAFDVYDRNGDGQIDKKEMVKVVTAIYDLLGEGDRKGENSPENRVRKIMLRLDRDEDNQISREEFVDGCLKDEILRQLLAPNV